MQPIPGYTLEIDATPYLARREQEQTGAIPPLRLGSVQLDLAFFILFLLTYVLLNVLQRL